MAQGATLSEMTLEHCRCEERAGSASDACPGDFPGEATPSCVKAGDCIPGMPAVLCQSGTEDGASLPFLGSTTSSCRREKGAPATAAAISQLGTGESLSSILSLRLPVSPASLHSCFWSVPVLFWRPVSSWGCSCPRALRGFPAFRGLLEGLP